MAGRSHHRLPPEKLEIRLVVGKRSDGGSDLPDILCGGEQEPSVTRRLRTVYFDTPSHDLRLHQISLRVREVDSSWRQTVKCETRIKSGLSHPIEVEGDVAGPKPDLRAIADAKLRRRLRKIIGAKRLKQIFEKDIRRTTQLVSDSDGNQIEIAYDDAAIKTTKDTEKFTELKLGLKRGHPSGLMEVIRLLTENNIPIRLSSNSETERGCRCLLLNSDAELKPVKLKPSAVATGQKVPEAFRMIGLSTVAQILHNWSVVLNDTDSGGPHQLRIGVRFLRTLLRAFRPEIDSEELRRLERDLRELARIVGKLRDLDVLSLEVVGGLDRPDELAAGFKELDKDLTARRERQRAAVREILRSQEMQTLQIRLALLPNRLGWEHVRPDTPLTKRKVESIARKALDRSWRHARSLGKRIDKLSIEERHDLRKKLKVLRYTLDAFSPLYQRKKFRRFVRDLKRLQDIFGYLNDATLAVQLHDRADTLETNAVQQTIGYVVGYHASNSAFSWHDARRRWAKLVADDRPWS
ncbi:MAG: CHAD domain-containing protein [Hyphomicrobiaceae bacterium]